MGKQNRHYSEIKNVDELLSTWVTRYANDVARTTESQVRLVHEFAANEMFRRIKNDTKQYVPWKTGSLAKSTRYPNHSSKDFQVSYGAGYAKYALNPYTRTGKLKKYTHTVHPLASGMPLQTATKYHRNEWLHVYDNAFNSLMEQFFRNRGEA